MSDTVDEPSHRRRETERRSDDPQPFGDDEPFQIESDTGSFTMVPTRALALILTEHRPLQVYILLLSMADNETGQCYPSHKYLAERLGCSKATVRRAIDRLHELRLVKRRRQKGGAGKPHGSNLYLVVRHVRTPCSPMSTGGDTHDQGGVLTHEQLTRPISELDDAKLVLDDHHDAPVAASSSTDPVSATFHHLARLHADDQTSFRVSRAVYEAGCVKRFRIERKADLAELMHARPDASPEDYAFWLYHRADPASL